MEFLFHLLEMLDVRTEIFQAVCHLLDDGLIGRLLVFVIGFHFFQTLIGFFQEVFVRSCLLPFHFLSLAFVEDLQLMDFLLYFILEIFPVLFSACLKKRRAIY